MPANNVRLPDGRFANAAQRQAPEWARHGFRLVFAVPALTVISGGEQTFSFATAVASVLLSAVTMSASRIEYSEKYADDMNEYR
jgi:hypothetical protein